MKIKDSKGHNFVIDIKVDWSWAPGCIDIFCGKLRYGERQKKIESRAFLKHYNAQFTLVLEWFVILIKFLEKYLLVFSTFLIPKILKCS